MNHANQLCQVCGGPILDKSASARVCSTICAKLWQKQQKEKKDKAEK